MEPSMTPTQKETLILLEKEIRDNQPPMLPLKVELEMTELMPPLI